MSTFKIYPLGNFQTCNTVLLTRVTMYITFPWLVYSITEVCTFQSTSPLCLCSQLPTSGHHQSSFCNHVLDLLIYWFLGFTYKWDHMVFLFLWLITLSIISVRSYPVWQKGKISVFLWLSNVLLYMWYINISSLSTLLSVNILVDSISWLL